MEIAIENKSISNQFNTVNSDSNNAYLSSITSNNNSAIPAKWKKQKAVMDRSSTWVKSNLGKFVDRDSPVTIGLGDIDETESLKLFQTVCLQNSRSLSAAVAKVEFYRDSALNELDEYKTFKEGWDGYYGKVFDKELIEFMQKLTTSIVELLIDDDFLPIEITPGPASDGSIDVEFSFNKLEIVITAYPDLENVSIYINDEDGEKEYSLSDDAE